MRCSWQKSTVVISIPNRREEILKFLGYIQLNRISQKLRFLDFTRNDNLA